MTTTTRPKFTVTPRDASGKGVARKLRAQGKIPAVCYGMGQQSRGVVADPDELYKLLTGKRRTNVVFELEIEGEATHSHVMVREYQIDPVRRELRHADFVVIDPEERLRVTIPVVPEGRPVGVREGGRLQMVRGEVDVWCDPDAIPVEVVYDVSELGLGDAVLASELTLPDGVEPAYKVDYAVVRVAIPRGTEQAAAAAAALGADVDLSEFEEEGVELAEEGAEAEGVGEEEEGEEEA